MFRAMSFRGFASDSNGLPAPWQYEQSTLSEFRNSCITPPPCTVAEIWQKAIKMGAPAGKAVADIGPEKLDAFLS